MTERFIAGVSGYLPLLRLDRSSASKALRFSGLSARRDGFRAVAGWDEDAFTMSVEAARKLVGPHPPSRLVFASTSAYYLDRPQSALAVDALALPRVTRTQDVGASRRSGTSALMDALENGGDTLVTVAEKRETQAGSPQQMAFGDGAAAVRISDSGIARYLGGASRTHDFVDLYVSRDRMTPYAYEERFIRDVATAEIIVPTIKDALSAAGITADRIVFAAVAEPLAGMYPAIARAVGLKAPNFATDLATQAGDLGAAHPLFALGLAIHAAAPGDIVLVCGFGGGCDAMLFEVTASSPTAADMADSLTRGQKLTDYMRFLNLSGAIDLAWGMRSEFEQKAQATVLERHGRDILGFIGGRDSLGKVQFPKSRIPVNPALKSAETLSDVRLADEFGRLVSATADRLNFTPDPPFDFGLVQFENGARVMMELTDREADGFSVGDALMMRLRVKTADKRRGFRTYFWKAAPAERKTLEMQ